MRRSGLGVSHPEVWRLPHGLRHTSYHDEDPSPSHVFTNTKALIFACFFPPIPWSKLFTLLFWRQLYKACHRWKKKKVFQYLLKSSKSVLVLVWRPAADTGHYSLCPPHTPSCPTPVRDRHLQAAGSDQPTCSWGDSLAICNLMFIKSKPQLGGGKDTNSLRNEIISLGQCEYPSWILLKCGISVSEILSEFLCL